MKNKTFFQRVADTLFVEFQHIQNLKAFSLMEIALIIIGVILIYIEYPNKFFHMHIFYRFFELLMITLPIAAIFQAYKFYKKTEWIVIGDKHINVPLYLEGIKRNYQYQKEKYSVETEISRLYQDFQDRENEIMTDLESCKDYETFKKIIIPKIRKMKNIKIPVLYMKGKEYVPEHIWYLGLLLRIKDYITLYIKNNEIIGYIQNELDEILSKNHYDEDELDHFKRKKDFSRYVVKMNQLVRIIGMHYATYLDNVDKHEENIDQLKKVFKENPELDDFVNKAVLNIQKKEKERWEKKVSDLELDNYLIMKYKNNIN